MLVFIFFLNSNPEQKLFKHKDTFENRLAYSFVYDFEKSVI